ncbi:MAG: NAD(P)H-dependent oxidoreductase subunit E [Ghiorsea sp.]|nr:NAD(P)H-dependent oxidoreductase subunit E [Ghiorsea sp.]
MMPNTNEELMISPYKRHVIMCVGKSCGENMLLLKYMKEAVAKADLAEGADAVRVNRAGCLGVCKQGPIMVVYPEGVWYADLDEAKVDKIVESHFKHNVPVADWVFHALV